MERRYTVISADTHCGADVVAYRPYLASKFHDEFDAWAATYEVPFADLRAPTAIAVGTPTGAWPSTRPTASWPRSCSPTPSRPSSRRAISSPSRPARPTTSDGGPVSRPTTAGWPTSVPPRPADGPASSRSS